MIKADGKAVYVDAGEMVSEDGFPIEICSDGKVRYKKAEITAERDHKTMSTVFRVRETGAWSDGDEKYLIKGGCTYHMRDSMMVEMRDSVADIPRFVAIAMVRATRATS